jgi:hypothetical protein
MSKQTAVELSEMIKQRNEFAVNYAKQKGWTTQIEDLTIKQLHEIGICFYDEYGNLEDVKGGDHE